MRTTTLFSCLLSYALASPLAQKQQWVRSNQGYNTTNGTTFTNATSPNVKTSPSTSPAVSLPIAPSPWDTWNPSEEVPVWSTWNSSITYQGNGQDSGLYSKPPDIALLTPSYPPDHDDQDTNHLRPSPFCHHYFTVGDPFNDATPNSQYASVRTTYQYLMVNLDHTAYASATLSGTTLLVTFTNPQAFGVAQSSWPSTEIFVLVTIEGGDQGQPAYHIVSSFSFDGESNTCSAIVTSGTTDDVHSSYDITWGHTTASGGSSGAYPNLSQPKGLGGVVSGYPYWPDNGNNGGSTGDDWNPWNGQPTSSSGPGQGSGNSRPGSNNTGPGSGNPTPNYNTTGNGWNKTEPTGIVNASSVVDTSAFDGFIDDNLGYYVWDQSDIEQDVKDFGGGALTDYNWDDYDDESEDADGLFDDAEGNVDTDLTTDGTYYKQDVGTRLRRSIALRKRDKPSRPEAAIAGFKVLSAEDIAKKAQSKKSIWEKIGDGFNAIGKGLNVFGKVIASTFDGQPKDYDEDLKWEIPEESETTFAKQTIWPNRKAIELFKFNEDKATVYCVDCGTKSDMRLKGRVNYNLILGFVSGEIEATGAVQAGLHVGIAGEATQEFKKEIRVFEIGLPGLTIPKIITVGPMITVDAAVGLTLTATGNMLAGGSVKVTGSSTKVNIKDFNDKQDPIFKPEFTPVFEVNGKIGADAFIALPIGLQFGLDIGSGSVKAVGYIKDTPSLHLNASVATDPAENNNCDGVFVGFNFQNELTVGGEASALGNKAEGKVDLLNPPIKVDIASKCFPFPGKTKRDDPLIYQNENVTETGDTTNYVDDDDTISYTGEQYPVDQQPFANLEDTYFSGVDSDGDGVNDLDEYNLSSYVLSFLNTTESNFTSPDDGSTKQQTGSTFNYTTVTDNSGNYSIITSPEGNLGLVPNGADWYDTQFHLFSVYNQVLIGDGMGRTLFYYPDEVAAYNVSRLRVGNETHIPKTSASIGLVPISAGEQDPQDSSVQENPLAAIDDDGNALYPVVCDYKDTSLPSKIFLAADGTTGPTTLTDTSLIDVITGGEVTQCQILAMITTDDLSI